MTTYILQLVGNSGKLIQKEANSLDEAKNLSLLIAKKLSYIQDVFGIFIYEKKSNGEIDINSGLHQWLRPANQQNENKWLRN